MKLFKEIAFAAALTAAAVLTTPWAHAQDEIKAGNLTIQQPWSRQSPMKTDVAAAGFLTITNTGSEDDRLVKATADITANVQLHDMKMENDVMKMVELPEGIPIPSGQTVELKPKSLHVMFLNLKSQVKEGDVITGTLVFEKAGSVDIQYQVKAPDAGMN